MKIAVIGANGKSGSAIVKEALSRGLDVTAIIRGENQSGASKAIQKDLFDLTYDDIKDFDVLISAFAAWTDETLPQHTTSLTYLSSLIRGKNIRLLVVGGAGSLYISKEHTLRLMDTPDFPDGFKPLAKAMAQGLEALRQERDVNWTYISPAADFVTDRKRTGHYILAGEELTPNAKGESVISYADYAIAMIDEATKGTHSKKRISVVEK